MSRCVQKKDNEVQFFLLFEDLSEQNINFKTTAIKTCISITSTLSFAWLLKTFLNSSAKQFSSNLRESFPFRASPRGNTRVSGVTFVCRSHGLHATTPNGELVRRLICHLFIDLYHFFRLFPDFSLLLQNILRIIDLHVTCLCRSSPLSQSLVLLGK